MVGPDYVIEDVQAVSSQMPFLLFAWVNRSSKNNSTLASKGSHSDLSEGYSPVLDLNDSVTPKLLQVLVHNLV